MPTAAPTLATRSRALSKTTASPGPEPKPPEQARHSSLLPAVPWQIPVGFDESGGVPRSAKNPLRSDSRNLSRNQVYDKAQAPHVQASTSGWLPMQFKLAVAAANDPLEAEADRIAAHVLSTPAQLAMPSIGTIGVTVTRKCSKCEHEEEQEKERMQARFAPSAHRGSETSTEAPALVRDLVRTPGQPLDPVQRSFFESRLGYDLSGVHIHSDRAGAISAATVNALAYTVGQHVVFGAGRYQPGTAEGKNLLAHELVHTIQQKGSRKLARKPEEGSPAEAHSAVTAQSTAISQSPQQVTRKGDGEESTQGSVGSVQIYLGGGLGSAVIKFMTDKGSYSYILDSLGNLKAGQYPVKVKVKGKTKVEFTFDLSAGQLFHFSYSIKPGQPNPATLFANEGAVSFTVTDEKAPEPEKAPVKSEDSDRSSDLPQLQQRVNAFKRMVKAAGQVRMSENRKALANWRTFLEKKLTPQQAEHMAYAQEVRDLQAQAVKEGGRSLDAYDEAVSSANPIRRYKAEGQVQGSFRACTGCHLENQAQQLEKENPSLLHSGQRDWTPPTAVLREYAAADAANPAPRPTDLKSSPGEGLSKANEIHDPSHPGATAASASLASLQPYMQILGPQNYDVLPPDLLINRPEAKDVLAAIVSRIEERRAGYAKFSAKIAEPDFDYLTLRPIVRDLLPLQDEDVQQAIEAEVKKAEEWEKVKSYLMWGISIGLLLLAIFPPTSLIGIADVGAAEGVMGAYAISSGIDSMEQGYWLSQSKGANDVTDPEQQAAAGMMMAMGLFSIVMGALGLKGAIAKGLKLYRASRAATGAAGAAGGATVPPAADLIDKLEGEAGGNRIVISEISSGNPKVKVTAPNGDTLYEGPLKDMPQGGFGAGETAPAVKPDTATFARQRVSALQETAASKEAEALEMEGRAARVKDPKKAAQFKEQADAMRKEASTLRDEAASYASGAKHPLHDLPTPEDIDAAIDRVAAGGTPQQKIEVPLSQAERTGNLERLSRGVMRTSRGRVVFRVEGSGSRTLLNVDAAGSVKTTPGTTYLNFGSVERALEFLAKRGPGARIVAFEVDEAWAQSVRSGAVPETGTKFLTGKTPKLVDVKYAEDQFEIPSEMLPEMEKFIVPGSAKVLLTK